MLRHFPAAILLLSLLLRFALAAAGGQCFFWDEDRYYRGVQLYRALLSGDFPAAGQIVAMPEHALFPWVGAVVAAGQHAFAQLTAFGDWTRPECPSLTLGIAAALLSLFSTLNLALLHRLALRLGASAEEALWALLLLATANTAFYYSRHLLPYECAISAALLALVVGLGPPTLARAFLCGLLTGATYHLYNGYWFLVPVIALLCALAWRGSSPWPRLGLAATGLFASLAFPFVLGFALRGPAYLDGVVSFGRTVTQGLFTEGWRLPWEYLAQSEGGFGLAIVGLLVGMLASALRRREPLPPRVIGALLAIAAIYALLVLFSCVLTRFVVYGRTVKPLVPALCLLGGWALTRLLASRPSFRPFAATVLVLIGVLRFWPHFTHVFPREVEVSVLRAWGNPKHALTISGSIYAPLNLPVARPDFALLNAEMLYPVRARLEAPAGVTLLRFEHPLSYPPYQYEGHTPRERELLRTTDVSIRLVRLADPASVPDNPPPAAWFHAADRPTGR